MIATCVLPPSAKHFVVNTPRTSRFYLLTKIHKPNNPVRPIVPACSCLTENISAYPNEVLAPFVRSLFIYVKDTNQALHIFDSFRLDTTTAVILDIAFCSPRLCTQFFLTTVDILQALTHSLDKRDIKEHST